MTQILNMGPWLSALIVISSIIFVVMISYFLTRQILGANSSTETETLASSIIFRTASLHGLILALVFAQEQVNVLEIRRSTVEESNAVADIFYDLKRYDSNATNSLRVQLAEYTKEVIEQEWSLLSEGQLSQKAWELWDSVYMGVLDLQPANSRQKLLRERMLVDVDVISSSRDLRQTYHDSGITFLFWLVAFTGVVFVVLPYFVFEANRVNLILLGSYAAFTALVIYTIIAMSNPYKAPIVVQPKAMIKVFNQDMEKILQQ